MAGMRVLYCRSAIFSLYRFLRQLYRHKQAVRLATNGLTKAGASGPQNMTTSGHRCHQIVTLNSCLTTEQSIVGRGPRTHDEKAHFIRFQFILLHNIDATNPIKKAIIPRTKNALPTYLLIVIIQAQR